MTAGLIGAPLHPGRSKCSSQVKVHAEALYTTDVPSRRTLPFCSYFFATLLTASTFFPGGKKRLLLQGAVFLLIILVSPPLSGGQPGSIGHMTMVWTAKLLLCWGAGGLAVQPYMATKWKPWVLYWIYTQSHLTVQTTILGRENGEEKYSAHNFMTLAERWEHFMPKITSLVYILLYVPIWTYDNYGM